MAVSVRAGLPRDEALAGSIYTNLQHGSLSVVSNRGRESIHDRPFRRHTKATIRRFRPANPAVKNGTFGTGLITRMPAMQDRPTNGIESSRVNEAVVGSVTEVEDQDGPVGGQAGRYAFGTTLMNQIESPILGPAGNQRMGGSNDVA